VESGYLYLAENALTKSLIIVNPRGNEDRTIFSTVSKPNTLHTTSVSLENFDYRQLFRHRGRIASTPGIPGLENRDRSIFQLSAFSE
jgi:hypothetical protein